MVYDSNSLFADVGGYLGLLLGESIYGIFDMISQWMVTIIARRKKTTRVAPTQELRVEESVQ